MAVYSGYGFGLTILKESLMSVSIEILQQSSLLRKTIDFISNCRPFTLAESWKGAKRVLLDFPDNMHLKRKRQWAAAGLRPELCRESHWKRFFGLCIRVRNLSVVQSCAESFGI